MSTQKIQGRDGFSSRTQLRLLSAKTTIIFLLGKAKVLSLGLNELQGLPSLTPTVWEATGRSSIAQSAWELFMLIKGGHRLRTAGKYCQQGRERETGILVGLSFVYLFECFVGILPILVGYILQTLSSSPSLTKEEKKNTIKK